MQVPGYSTRNSRERPNQDFSSTTHEIPLYLQRSSEDSGIYDPISCSLNHQQTVMTSPLLFCPAQVAPRIYLKNANRIRPFQLNRSQERLYSQLDDSLIRSPADLLDLKSTTSSLLVVGLQTGLPGVAET